MRFSKSYQSSSLCYKYNVCGEDRQRSIVRTGSYSDSDVLFTKFYKESVWKRGKDTNISKQKN